MKAHEIIKELRLLAPNGILKLLTISESIKELRDYVHESNNSKGAWQLIDLIEQLSDCVVTLSQFVPCDENGVPLEKPTNHEKWLEYQEHGFELLFGNEAENQAYNEAKKSIVFEGWEVSKTEKIHHKAIINKDQGLYLEFYKEKESVVTLYKKPSDSYCILVGNADTIADLAEATTKNPIKLK